MERLPIVSELSKVCIMSSPCPQTSRKPDFRGHKASTSVCDLSSASRPDSLKLPKRDAREGRGNFDGQRLTSPTQRVGWTFRWAEPWVEVCHFHHSLSLHVFIISRRSSCVLCRGQGHFYLSAETILYVAINEHIY